MSDSEFEDFDPYRIWLSIPKAEQPPNHYRLLGVSLYESDARVIEEAADRQVAHLKTKQTSARVALSQQLLTEVSAATAVLLDPQARAKYDAKLKAAIAAKTPATKPNLPQAAPLPQARPLQPQPLPQQPVYQQPVHPQPVHQQPVYHQPQYQQPGYQQPGYQQPGYAQPVQQPAYQQPAYQQPYAQQPQPLQPQPLRPVAIQQSEPTALESVAVESTPVVSSNESTTSSFRPRRKEQNAGFEIAKVAIGGGVGLAIGAIVLVAIGKSDFLYGLVGMKPPVQVTQGPPKPRPSNNSGNSNKGNNSVTPRPASNGNGGGSSNTNSSESNVPGTSIPNDTNSASNSGTTDPANNPTQPAITTSNNTPAVAIPLPAIDPTTTQVASAAMREGMSFVHDTFRNLSSSLLRPENKKQAHEQLSLIMQLQGNESPVGAIPTSDSQLMAYRKTLVAQFDPIDAKYINNGNWPNFSYKILASMSIPSRPNAPEPQGQIYRPNSLDAFPQKLGEYTDGVLSLAQTNRANAEAHDRLCYVAAVAQVLKFAYLRGNTEQFSSCLLLDALSPEVLSALASESQRRRFNEFHLALLGAAGFAEVNGDVASDPRKQFRGSSTRGNSTYTRLADGRWMEQNSTSGTLYYRERKRTPAIIELAPVAQQGPAVRLALAWCVALTPATQGGGEMEAYSEGAWDIEKLGRSLTPRLAVTLPTPRTTGSTVSTTQPNTNPTPQKTSYALSEMPGTAVTDISTLRSGDRIYAIWGGSRYYPATILSVFGADIRIRYDDQVQESTTIERIRLMGPTNMVATNPQPGPNPPFNPSPLPTPNSPAPTDQAKKLWRHAGGFIEYVDGMWKELSPSGDYFTLSVVGQGADVMEVERLEAPGLRLRFYDNRCEYSISPYTQYVEICKGNWVTPIEEVELEAAQANAIKKNVDLYTDLVGKARKNMSDRFEAAMSSNRKRVGKAEERLAVVALLEAEQARFEKEGLVPWSTPMRSATADYLSSVNRARTTSEAAFDKAIDYFVHHEQPNVAHAVLALKQKTLVPLMVARLIVRDPNRDPAMGGMGLGGVRRQPAPIPAGLPPDVVDQIMRDRARQGLDFPAKPLAHRLWSNGQLNDVVGPSKWVADTTGIMLNFVKPTSTTRERVAVSERGDEFAAQSTTGSTYNGSLASALEPNERRPEVKYNPKPKAAPVVKPDETKSDELKPAPMTETPAVPAAPAIPAATLTP